MYRCNETQPSVHTNKKPGTHIVICLIEVWTPKSPLDFMSEPVNPLMLTECLEMECNESYKEFVHELDLRFPKGTVVRKTIADYRDVYSAHDSIHTTRVDDGGVVIHTSSKTRKADVADFSVGRRIRVWTGYTTDPKIARLGSVNIPSESSIYGSAENLSKYRKAMDKTFDGFITRCSPSDPIQIHGESITTIFKRIACVEKNLSNGLSMKQLIDPNGTVKLFGNSGVELHQSNPLAKLDSIHISPVVLKNNMTAADAISSYGSRFGVYFRMQDDNGVPKMRIGYSFSSGLIDNSTETPCIYGNGDGSHPVIYADYNVASDNLSFMNVDPYYVVVKCTVNIVGKKGKRKKYTFHVRIDPTTLENVGKYKVFNESKFSRQDQKKQESKDPNDPYPEKPVENKPEFDLSGYKIIDRVYPKPVKEESLNKKEIQAWASAQLEDCVKNGVEGSLTLFGDLGIHTGDIVQFIDPRTPARNGCYIVDNVVTSLSPSGLRQNITLPYKVAQTDAEKKIEEQYMKTVKEYKR